MDFDDAPSRRTASHVALAGGEDLGPLSVAELDGRLAALEGEIVRTRAARDRAVNHRASADALFGR